jgi:hypothetical protein
MPGWRVLVLGGLAALAVALVAATGSGSPSSGTRTHGTATAEGAAYSAQCPDALAPGQRAYLRVARAVRREVPRVFPNSPRNHFSHRFYSVWAQLSLADRGGREVGFPRAKLIRKATAACGRTVALHSWAVLIDFPRAPAADLGTYVTYLARTVHGWRFWYGWLPYSTRKGFFLSSSGSG